MYKIETFVPPEHAEAVKQAIFTAGAGRVGAYAACCWQVQGVGQFTCLEGSNPTIGKPGSSETVAETKIETVAGQTKVREVVAALKKAHPYELPAIFVTKLEKFD